MKRRLLGRQLGRGTQLEDGRVQVRDFLVLCGDSGSDGQLLPIALRRHLLLEAGNLPLLRQDGLILLEQLRLVRLLRRHGLRTLFGLILRMQFGQPALDLGVEFGPADLGNDGSIVGLIDREDTSAIGAFQFVHIGVVFFVITDNPSSPTPYIPARRRAGRRRGRGRRIRRRRGRARRASRRCGGRPGCAR